MAVFCSLSWFPLPFPFLILLILYKAAKTVLCRTTLEFPVSVIKVTDLDLKGKRVFIRADLNVPVKDGKVTSDARITASMATINYCLKQGARVMVTSHLGRPEEGLWSQENSLQPVADNIAERLGKPVRLIKDWARAGRSVVVSSHILHEVEAMTSNILLINNGRILAEGNVHQIRELIDEHPHTVFIRAAEPRELGRRLLAGDDVLSMRFEPGAVVVETARPDAFYARVTEMAASGEAGRIDEVTSPDDNLQAVFRYLVKQ